MRTATYYGEYKSSTLSQTGCLKRFVTTGHSSILFPPQTQYTCDLCPKQNNKEQSHGFSLVRTWAIYTDKQIKDFNKYCEDNLIESDVSIL